MRTTALSDRLSAFGCFWPEAGSCRPSVLGLQLAEQRGEHAFDLLDRVLQCGVGRDRKKTEVTREQKLTFQLTSRTESHLNEAREAESDETPLLCAAIEIAAATAAFCEIGADRNGGTPHLIGETVLFTGGKLFRNPVSVQCDPVCELPDFEFPKILHPRPDNRKPSSLSIKLNPTPAICRKPIAVSREPKADS